MKEEDYSLGRLNILFNRPEIRPKMEALLTDFLQDGVGKRLHDAMVTAGFSSQMVHGMLLPFLKSVYSQAQQDDIESARDRFVLENFRMREDSLVDMLASGKYGGKIMGAVEAKTLIADARRALGERIQDALGLRVRE